MDVGDLCLDVSLQEDAELFQTSRFLLIRARNVAHSRLRLFRSVLQIQLVPLLWSHLAFVRYFSAAVQCLLVDDVQHDFRIHVAASGAGAGFSVGIAGSLLEIGNGVNGITVEHGIATAIQQPQTVKQLVDITGGLMDIHHNQLALICLLFQQVDDLLCIC